jgi:putative ABC transport system permease protein
MLVRYLWRRKLRTFCTLLGVAAAVLLFVLLRTVVSMWEQGADHAAQDRLYTRHKISFALKIPRRYADEVATVPGVEAVTWAVWMGLRDERQPRANFASYAVSATTVFDVYRELAIPEPQRLAWLQDRQGVVLGAALAQRLRVKVGDRLTLQGTLYPGNWELRVAGIYRATRRSFDEMSLMMHWRYLDEVRRQTQQGEIGWVTSRVDDPRQGPAVAMAIDRLFAGRDLKTATMNERAANEAFLSFMQAIVAAVKGVSLLLLIIMALVLGNTVAIATRENTRDYATLRALGFPPGWIRWQVFAQALLLAGAAAGLALLAAGPLLSGGLGRWIEANMAALFPSFHLDLPTAVEALLLVCAVALVAAFVPAQRLLRLPVTDGLRKVV